MRPPIGTRSVSHPRRGLRAAARIASAPALRALGIAGHRCDDVAGMMHSIRLADYGDAETRARLQAIRTGLTIPHADVDALVSAGETMARQDGPALAAFLETPR